MQEDTSSTTFISTEEIIWEEVELSIEGLGGVSELIKKCEQLIEQLRQTGYSTCLTIVFTGTGDISSSLQTPQTIQDLLDALNDVESEDDQFVWVVKILNKTYEPSQNNPNLVSFLADLHTTVEKYQSFAEVVRPIEQHPVYRKYISEFTLEEQQQLLKEAEQLLHSELLQQSEVKKR
jgi:hypothetical protein